MKTIHKFRINTGKEPTRLTLKQGFRVVRCEYLVSEKGVYLWVEQLLKVVIPTVERQFRIAFSGEPVPENHAYLGTALDPFGPEAYHVFEVPVEALPASDQHAAAPALLDRARYQPIGTN